MGMFDTFKGVCPHCKDLEFYSQTKVTPSQCCDTYKVGDYVGLGGGLELKEPCEKCKQYVIAVFDEEGILVEFSTDKRYITKRESFWGGLIPEGKTREEVESAQLKEWEEFGKLLKQMRVKNG
jgi:hypothetical protein